MRSRFPKVTHALGGRPMLEHVLRVAHEAVAGSSADPAPATPSDPPADAEDHSTSGAARSPTPYVVIVGHEHEQVRAAVRWMPPDATLVYVTQEPQCGTGDAVRHAEAALRAAEPAPETILVLYGDTPLVRPETLRALLARHHETGAALTILTGFAPDPDGYGRIIRDKDNQISGIVEARHASAEVLRVAEINSGVCCFDAAWLWPHLSGLAPHENGEFYLTDLVGIALDEGRHVASAEAQYEETMGINDRVQLAEAEGVLRRRLLQALMRSGVTIEDPASTYVDAGVRVGADTILRPGTTLRGDTVIGEGCEIGPNSLVRDSLIGDGCRVLASWVESAVMEAGSRVGPMSHLRPGARLLAGAQLGNFAEVKNATIGERVHMHHFSYVGDATVGAEANIGAGAITMNFDGREKHHTEIGERAFIGSDTLLRAPVTVGDGAATGGGAVVTRDVPPGKLVVGMPARQIRRVASAASATTPPGSVTERAALTSRMQQAHEAQLAPRGEPPGEPPEERASSPAQRDEDPAAPETME